MNEHKWEAWKKQALSTLRIVLFLFCLNAFIITCSLMVFLSVVEHTTGVAITQEYIRPAAILTFINVLFLTLGGAAADTVRRKIMIERPVLHIINAADKIMKGDFSARIPPLKNFGSMNGYDIIIDYFNKMAGELSGVETLRSDFVANVSHELKTPLAVMQNYGTMLQKPGLTEEKRIEYAKAITESSRRLAELIANILKLNKLENQQIYPEKQVYNLGEQLCECLLNFESTWEKKEIEIDTDIEEEIFVESDAELLSLVWNNLFSNAMKFTEPGGAVTLTLKADTDFAVVKVSDTGCGISPEVGRHIFEKFYQGDTSHATQGNGLGLALVKRVIDIVGGDVSVSSEIGKGSIFTVRLRRNKHGTN